MNSGAPLTNSGAWAACTAATPWFTVATALIPAWLGLPIAGLTLIVLAGHVLALQEMPMPVRRRRIRTVNGILMMLGTALIAYAVAVMDSGPIVTVRPEAARRFMVVWILIMGLLAFIVTLAGFDALGTVRQHNLERAELRLALLEHLGARGILADLLAVSLEDLRPFGPKGVLRARGGGRLEPRGPR